MKKYKASLTINGERSEGEGELSLEGGETVLSATFPKGESTGSVRFTPEEFGCVMEKRGELTIFSRFIQGQETEMACDSPYGRIQIPVRTLGYRYKSTENGATLWLSYVVLYGEEGGEATEESFSDFANGGAESCAGEEEDAFFGGKFSVLFTLKRKDPVC